ncbi:hypothetical protein V8G54_020601 [Vigna mungo]|uniref:GRF-type domain-containing protein n=1 Tax=Vigna mungo TaxID=3915 RepID=A0AAQ3NE25_VIGMU
MKNLDSLVGVLESSTMCIENSDSSIGCPYSYMNEIYDSKEEEGEATADKEDESKSAIKWEEEDQKNLMDLGNLELDINLEKKRRQRRLIYEKNLIDLDFADIPVIHNPFDFPDDSFVVMGLPLIPGFAPSILQHRRNPFDISYNSNEEKPDLKRDNFQQEFIVFHKKDSLFRRHESFSGKHLTKKLGDGPVHQTDHRHEVPPTTSSPLNGPLRCRRCHREASGLRHCDKHHQRRPEDRIGFFKRYCDLLGVGYGNNLDCYSDTPLLNSLLNLHPFFVTVRAREEEWWEPELWKLCLWLIRSNSCGSVSRVGLKPTCFCGENAVFRTARTPKNKGRRFWGCPKFKGGSEDCASGCKFFKWCNEDVIDEGNEGNVVTVEGSGRKNEVGGNSMMMEQMMMKMEERLGEKLKIPILQKSVVRLENWLKLLMGMMVIICLCNVIVISMLLKIG